MTSMPAPVDDRRPITADHRKDRAMHKMITCLWFDDQAEEAADFYIGVFPNSKIRSVARYTKAGPRPEGSVMTVEFELNGSPFVGLNGGPEFTFNESISFQIPCESQDEIDHYWNKLIEDGGQESVCGWLKDKYGVSWQVFPTRLIELTTGSDRERAARVTEAMYGMRKIDLRALEAAAERQPVG